MKKEYLEPQAILTHEASLLITGDPGENNLRMAHAVLELLKECPVPVFAQEGVARCLPKPLLEHGTIASGIPGDKNYVDTRVVALWHKELCAKLQIRDVAVVAMAPHLPRVIATTQKLGLNVVLSVPVEISYLPDVVHGGWRNPIAMWFREQLATMYYRFRGWL